MTEAYPLQWPAGRPRKMYPERSRFGERSVETTRQILEREIKLLGGRQFVLSTNIRLRLDGLPYSKDRVPEDKGVAVYFTYKDRAMCFACDRWDRIPDNIYAIAMTIEALRGIERWGSGSMVEQAFTGFVALPSPKNAHEILGVHQKASAEEIDAAFRQKSKQAHPDAGGSTTQMQELIEARDRLRKGSVI